MLDAFPLQRFVSLAIGLPIALMLGGCTTTVDPAPDFERAKASIAASTGQTIGQSPFDFEAPPTDIDTILQDGITLDESSRIALESPVVMSAFMRVGIARADLEQAGLLANPSLSLLFLFPTAGGSPDVQAGIAQSVGDFFRLPQRRRVAEAGLDAAVLDAARLAAEQVARVRVSYFRCVAADQAAAVERENVILAERGLELVSRQVARGIATRVEESTARSRVLDAEVMSRRAVADVSEQRRNLASLLGVDADLATVELRDTLPDPDPRDIDGESLVKLATESRLDLVAAQALVTEAEGQLALERLKRWGDASVGIEGERPEGGTSSDWLIGPSIEVTVPIFDTNDVQVARAQYVWRERLAAVETLHVEVVNGVRAAADRAANAARTAIFIRDSLLPQAEESLQLAQRAFELGDATVLTLLESQRAVLIARGMRISSLGEAAVAISELEREVGAPLSQWTESSRR